MPKMIQNIREQLLAEAEKQISERGYARTTVRSIAKECGIAVGTVYNYFPSKETLIASFVADDWQRSIEAFKHDCPRESRDVLIRIYVMLQDFATAHGALFSDKDAGKVFSAVFSERHAMLREQIARLVLPICPDGAESKFLSRFIAESLLTWTMASIPFDELYSVLSRLIEK